MKIFIIILAGLFTAVGAGYIFSGMENDYLSSVIGGGMFMTVGLFLFFNKK